MDAIERAVWAEKKAELRKKVAEELEEKHLDKEFWLVRFMPGAKTDPKHAAVTIQGVKYAYPRGRPVVVNGAVLHVLDNAVFPEWEPMVDKLGVKRQIKSMVKRYEYSTFGQVSRQFYTKNHEKLRDMRNEAMGDSEARKACQDHVQSQAKKEATA